MKKSQWVYLSIYLAICSVGLIFLISLGCAKPPNWYTVTGTGMADENLLPQQRRLMARRAAIEDAWRQLLEAAKGVQIDSRTTVRDFITQDDAIRSRVEGIIRGAQIIDEEALPDGSYEVKMSLDMNRIKYLIR